MKVIHALILAALLQVSWGAETWPEVPDPFGLGPRLALIDWLQERKVKLPITATDDDLREAWRKASGTTSHEAETKQTEHDAQVAAERAKREARDRARSEAAVAAAIASVPDSPREQTIEEPELREPEAAGPSTAAPTAGPRSTPVASAQETSAAAVTTPTPRVDNLREWAENWITPSSSTRTGTTVSLYTRRGDRQYYYLITERQRESSAAKVIIDDVDYGVATTGLRKVAVKSTFNASARLMLVAP